MVADENNAEENTAIPSEEETTKKRHVLYRIKPKEKGFNAQQAMFDCKDYICEFLSTCRRPADTDLAATRCLCMKWILEEDNNQ